MKLKTVKPNQKSTGRKLAIAMCNCGLSNAELADKANVSYSLIDKLKNRDLVPSPETGLRLELILGNRIWSSPSNFNRAFAKHRFIALVNERITELKALKKCNDDQAYFRAWNEVEKNQPELYRAWAAPVVKDAKPLANVTEGDASTEGRRVLMAGPTFEL